MRRALAFLTPLGGAAPPSPEAVRWFPAVGALVGVGVGVVWWGAAQVWPPGVAVTIAVVADLAFTGMLHIDGLMDAADGLLPPLPRERRLAVMADPAVGAFGVGAGLSVVLLRVVALAAMSPAPLMLAALWTASRTAMAWTIVSVPYMRPGGLAEAFIGRPRGVVPGGLALAFGLGIAAAGLSGAVAVAVVGIAAAGVVGFARQRVGGFTGDVLGAAGMVGETAGLLAAAARW